MADWEVLIDAVVGSHEPKCSDEGCNEWNELTSELVMDACKHEEEVQTADVFHSETASVSGTGSSIGAMPAPAPVPLPVPSPVRGLAFSSSGARSPPATTNMRTSSWWAQLLKQHVRDMGCPDPYDGSQQGLPPKTLVSACSGIFCEAEVLRVSQHDLETFWGPTESRFIDTRPQGS